MTSDRDPQLLKGVLPMLTLAALTHDESYGYELVAALRAAGLAELSTGTLYPVLTRLERDGLVTSRLMASSSGPARKYYRPSDAGLAALRTQRASWAALVATADRVLRAAAETAAAGTAATDTAPTAAPTHPEGTR
ncbi:PadR family transcriptional regulator [Cellulomonas iranensis]|uniref:PadR family transcriptional regulator n=1 Tax=Cellulomonas iranensis TaxID=76862 RepID=UPI000B3CDFCE|nr:PadR family transcriptional regulator [Cellulomonas iranensis]